MRRLFLLGFFLVLVATVLTIPALIAALPDRYVTQLPEPLQRYGIPEDETPLLPTVGAAAAAAQLLDGTASPTVESEPLPLEPIEPTYTATAAKPEPITASRNITVTAESSPTPTALPTATPSPSPTATATRPPLPQAVRLQGFVHRFQTWNNCGPATLAMTLTYFGDEVYQEQTAAVLKPDPEDRNVTPQEMAQYVNQETPYSAVARANGDLEILKQFLAHDIPVIVEVGIDPPGDLAWLGWYGHYLLVVAYDDSLEQFWVYDTWLGTGETPLENADVNGRVLSYERLAADWAQFNRNYIAVYRPEQEDDVRNLIGQNMDDAVMWQAALERAKSDVEANEENAFNWFNLGTNYSAQGYFEEAALAFDKSREIGLPWRMLWYQFGPYEAYLNTGRYEEVVMLADLTLEDRPYFEESYYYRGLAQAELGELPQARADLEKAARFNPNFIAAAQALEQLDS